MAWQIKDEWIDLAQGHHKVIFHNPDVQIPNADGKLVPVEHHLTHDFKLPACPHCGHVKEKPAEEIDFHAYKTAMHQALHAHHRQLMEYREKHKNVRIGTGPK